MSADDDPDGGVPSDDAPDRLTPTLACVETLVPPTGDAELRVDTTPTGDGRRVALGLVSEGMNAHLWLSPEEARAVADRLATAAADAECADPVD
jgi:hypothetical protein